MEEKNDAEATLADSWPEQPLCTTQSRIAPVKRPLRHLVVGRQVGFRAIRFSDVDGHEDSGPVGTARNHFVA